MHEIEYTPPPSRIRQYDFSTAKLHFNCLHRCCLCIEVPFRKNINGKSVFSVSVPAPLWITWKILAEKFVRNSRDLFFFLLVFFFFSLSSMGGARKRWQWHLLSCLLVLFDLPCFSLCSLIFPSPTALYRYLLSRLRIVSSVQQLSVPLQHVCCSSCSLSDLASHYSELLSAFCFVFRLFRPYAGIFFLVFVLFRPRSSCLLLFSTYVVLLGAFLIFLITFFRTPVGFFVLFLSFLFFWSGLFRCVVVPGSLRAFHLRYLD